MRISSFPHSYELSSLINHLKEHSDEVSFLYKICIIIPLLCLIIFHRALGKEKKGCIFVVHFIPEGKETCQSL